MRRGPGRTSNFSGWRDLVEISWTNLRRMAAALAVVLMLVLRSSEVLKAACASSDCAMMSQLPGWLTPAMCWR